LVNNSEARLLKRLFFLHPIAKQLFFDDWVGADDEDGDVKIYDLIDEIDITPEEEFVY